MPAIVASTIGYPRIGPNREVKKALESFWAGKLDQATLLTTAKDIDEACWKTQADAGIDLVALDGTLYDQVADFALLYLGLYPARFQHLSGLDAYFSAARGAPKAAALDMTKYFATNYHHLCPELDANSFPKPDWSALLDRVSRGQAKIGKQKAVPLLLGPLTIVGLSRGQFDASTMISRLVPAYQAALTELGKLGVPEVQIHEPIFSLTDAAPLQNDAQSAYSALSTTGVPIHLVVPYDDVTEQVYRWLVALPVAAIGLDFCGVPGSSDGNLTTQLIAKHGFPKDKRLGVGIVDGRSIWADDGTAANVVGALRKLLGPEQALSVQTSVSLQHVPIDLGLEPSLPPDLQPRLAFAVQKLHELAAARKAGESSNSDLNLKTYTGAPASSSSKSISTSAFNRPAPYSDRRPKQPHFHAFPTTTIGSFPQTPAIRKARLLFKRGELSEADYKERMAAEIGFCIGAQEALGLDVFVHGEAERTDMVEFFGVHLSGFVFTQNAWVQSYGSRYVRPPLITGNVKRERPMTTHEFQIAQNLTSKYVKGMLTGPVTILNWSFPLKNVPRSEQAFQIALALREEVADLEAAGCRILQVDEPALREGLPLKDERHNAYLDWATKSFRLATGVANPSVQIVTHLCYSQFEEIMPAIDALDADVLTIENSRSHDEMVHALAKYGYKRDIGPGVYDVHSPQVPSIDFIVNKARTYLKTGILNGDATRIWINCDCGLKTRRWEEVLPALSNMVAAARIAREELGTHGNGFR